MQKRQCPHCDRVVPVVDSSIGTWIVCPFCDRQFMAHEACPYCGRTLTGPTCVCGETPDAAEAPRKPRHVRTGQAFIAASIACLLLAAALLALRGGGRGAGGEWADRFLDWAPSGTWGIAVVDMRLVAASDLGRQALKGAAEDVPIDPEKVSAMALFFLPSQAGAERSGPGRCSGLIEFDGLTADELRQGLAELDESEVDGRIVYGRGPFYAVADDGTLLAGSDREALSEIVRIRAGLAASGADSELRSMASAAPAAAINVAAVLPSSIIEKMSESAKTLKGGAFSIDLSDGLSLTGVLRTGSAGQARELVARGREQLDETAARMDRLMRQGVSRTPMQRTVLAVIDRLRLHRRGPDVVVRAALGLDLGRDVAETIKTDVTRALEDAPKPVTEERLKRIGAAIAAYRAEHDGALPPTLESLVEGAYIASPEAFRDPCDREPVQRGQRGYSYSFDYVGPLPDGVWERVIICYSRAGLYEDEQVVLRLDGSLSWIMDMDAEAGGPQSPWLEKSYEAVARRLGDDVTEERRRQIKAFYGVR